MIRHPYLLFDAGGTLVLPDGDALVDLAGGHGIALNAAEIVAGHFRIVHAVDAYVRRNGRFPDTRARSYWSALLQELGVEKPLRDQIDEDAEARHQKENLWSSPVSSAHATLSHLAEDGYRMSVISNSDGRATEILAEISLAQYFERVYDSEIVGVDKPHAGIFDIALRELNLEPTDGLYVGDFFYVDVWGANQVGIGGVHLDPLGLYGSWAGVHLKGLEAFPDWLDSHLARPETSDIFPVRGHEIVANW